MCIACVLAVLFAPAAARAVDAEQISPAPIVRVDMFKNGFAVVTQDLDTQAGTADYVIDAVNSPVHGTLWVQADSPVTLKFFEREQKTGLPAPVPDADLLKSLIGTHVSITLLELDKLEGVLRSVSPDLMVIETGEGTQFVRVDEILSLSADKKLAYSTEATEMKPSIRVSLARPGTRQTVRISYLTRGISWAPSYRLDLYEKNKGRLQMTTVVRNELADIDNAEFFLISGFPSIQFKDVISPADAHTTWARFFSSLAGGSYGEPQYPAVQAQMTMNMARSMDFDGGGSSSPDIPTDDYDIHYLPAGRHSLKLNASLVLPLGDEALTYERVVQWHIPDNADIYGTLREPIPKPDESIQDDVWDAVKFDNPFTFPMTTAAIAMYQNNAFLGQAQALWSAPGQEVFTRITKAMNIKVDHAETEVPDHREQVRISGNNYTKSRVKASVQVKNNRKTKQKIIIRRRFSGKLLDAQGKPVITLMPEGATRLNERTQLEWELELDPGKEIKYEYTFDVIF